MQNYPRGRCSDPLFLFLFYLSAVVSLCGTKEVRYLYLGGLGRRDQVVKSVPRPEADTREAERRDIPFHFVYDLTPCPRLRAAFVLPPLDTCLSAEA